MNTTLIKATVALVPTMLLAIGSTAMLARRRNVWPAVQLCGSAFLMMVALAHICEALGWFPGMGWGAPHSVGHYVDLSCAVLGVTLFPAGWLKTKSLW